MNFLTTDLEKNAYIRHGFFTRLGGAGTGLYDSLNCAYSAADAPETVAENRARVARAVDVQPQNLVSLRQVHSAKVVTVTDPWPRDKAPEGDALVTNRAGIGLGILTADCVPVLFAAKRPKVIGAAHAGWKGAIGGVVEATIDAMEKLGAKASDISAAIGPCIGPASYEVGDAFKAPFLEQDPANERFFAPAARAGHFMFDIPAYVADRLQKRGVKKIFDTRQDTLANEGVFFSYRRACLRGEGDYGRQISVISIEEN